MKKFIAVLIFALAFMMVGQSFVEAATPEEIRAAKEIIREVEKSSFDVNLVETRDLLDKIERMQIEGDSSWKSLIIKAFNNSWRLYKKRASVPETSYLVARSFFYNGRPDKAKRSLRKTLYYNSLYVPAHIMWADIKLLESQNNIDSEDGIDFLQIEQMRKEYEKVFRLKGVTKEDESKIFMKIGNIYAEFALNKEKARDYWQKSYDAAPESYWGKRSKSLMEEAN
jgi:hypothetical protein